MNTFVIEYYDLNNEHQAHKTDKVKAYTLSLVYYDKMQAVTLNNDTGHTVAVYFNVLRAYQEGIHV